MADDDEDTVTIIVTVLELCQVVGDALINLQEQLFGLVKTQCRGLGQEVERAKTLHAELTKQMVKHKSYQGLNEYLRNEKRILETILERVQTSTPRRMQLHKRSQLRHFVVEKTKQLRREMKNLKDSFKDYNLTFADKIVNCHDEEEEDQES